MKQVLAFLFFFLVLPCMASPRPVPSNYTVGYNQGYHIGYSNGKHDNQDKVFKVIAGSFLVIVGGVIIYELASENTRWKVSQNGLGYRF